MFASLEHPHPEVYECPADRRWTHTSGGEEFMELVKPYETEYISFDGLQVH